jgi:phosphate transport system substrate-binding protein
MTSGSPALWPLKNGVQLPVFIDGPDESVMALRQQLEQPTTSKKKRPQGVNTPGILSVNDFWQGAKNEVQVVTSCEKVSNQPEAKKGDATPLKVPIYLIASPKKLAPIAREFWTFLMSLEAQKLVQNLGFESRTPLEVKFDASSGIILKSVLNTDADMRTDDLRNAIQSLLGYSRLSVSFRFLEGSQVLDETSQSNLGYLVNLLLSGRYDGREVIFAGFSDSQGSSEGNLKISLDRARAVRATINTMLAKKNVGQLQFQAIGLGEGLPTVCNNSDWGRYQNRRVEVWIK